MASPYNHQQLERLQEYQRQQILQMQQQIMMGGLTNANSMMDPIMLSGPMQIPHQAAMSHMKQLEISTSPIVVVESEEEDEDDEDQRTLFVANFDDRVTEELLYEIFVQTGPLEKVRIPKDNNGRQRTFGFVTFAHRCTPPYAMHLLQGLSLFRKTLTIKFNGKILPPPLKSPVLNSGSSSYDKNYDNSALRSGGGNYSSYNDKRMMDNTPPTSSRHQDRLSKHASSQMRPHTNSSPYHHQQQQRRDSPNHYDKRRYHNSNNNNNNGNNNRYSDHRNSSGSSSGGKYRR